MLSSPTSAGKQDILFFFFCFPFFFRAHWTHRKTRTCETFSLPHIFFGCHLPLQLLCLMVIASLSHQIIQIQPTWQPRHTHTHAYTHTHTQSAHICLAEFRWEGRSKRNGSSRITQQNEIISRTWFHLHEPSKMCVRSGLEVFDFIVLQWTPFFFYLFFFYCEALEPVSPQRELWSACFLFYESLSISRSC